jgi:hypothetical protein
MDDLIFKLLKDDENKVLFKDYLGTKWLIIPTNMCSEDLIKKWGRLKLSLKINKNLEVHNKDFSDSVHKVLDNSVEYRYFGDVHKYAVYENSGKAYIISKKYKPLIGDLVLGSGTLTPLITLTGVIIMPKRLDSLKKIQFKSETGLNFI